MVWVLAICFLLTQVIAVSPSVRAADFNQGAENNTTFTDRIYGSDRYETAVKIAQQGWPEQSENVVLAAGMNANLVDALAAAPLAKVLNAPILLNEADKLNPSVKAELIRLGVKTVFLVTGKAIFNQKVFDQLAELGITVNYLGGKNRFETVVNIAKHLGKFKKVIITTAWSNADALAISSVAAAKQMPILLSDKDALPSEVADYLNGMKNEISQTYIIGGTEVISSKVEDSVPNAQRIYGANRFETNIQILKVFADSFKYQKTYLANGENSHLVDALTGSLLAAKTSSPVILTSNALPDVTKTFAKLNLSPKVIALGGPGAVSEANLQQLSSLQNISESNERLGGQTVHDAEVYPDSVTLTGEKITFQNAKVLKSIYVQGNNCVLDNITISGTLFLDPGKEGTVTLNNVTAKRIVVLSGGKNSIHINNSEADNLVVSSDSETRIEATGTTQIGNTTVTTYAILDANGGKLGEVVVTGNPGEEPIVELRGTFDEPVVVHGEATVRAGAGANISELQIDPDSSNQQVTLQGSFNSVVVNGEAKVNLDSDAKVRKLTTHEQTELNVEPGAQVDIYDNGGNDNNVTSGGAGSIPESGQTTHSGSGGGGGENILHKLSLKFYTAVTLSQTGTIAQSNVQYGDKDAVIDALPSAITVTLEDDTTTASVPVIWTDTDTYNAGIAGSYTFTATWGTLPAGVDNVDNIAAPTVEIVVVQERHTGTISLNKADYQVGDSIELRLIDPDLDTDPNTSQTVTIRVKSSITDPSGIDIELNEDPDANAFLGYINIAELSNAGAGEIGAASNETLTVIYHDEANANNIPQDITATAAVSIVNTSTAFSPANNAVNVDVTVHPTITFSRAITATNGTAIGDGTNGTTAAASLITFKKGNASGADVAFSASINAEKKVITIIPAAVLDYSQVYYLAVADVKDVLGNTVSGSNSNFTVSPDMIFNPGENEENVVIDVQPTITFGSNIRAANGGAFGDGTNGTTNIEDIITFKKGSAAGEDVPFSAIRPDNKTVRITPSAKLDNNQVYYLAIGNIQDEWGRLVSGRNISFRTIPQATVIFTPADGATDVATDTTLTISFSRVICPIGGGGMFDDGSQGIDIETMITFKKDNADGADVGFSASIDQANQMVSVTPSVPLEHNQTYYLAMADVEDVLGNPVNNIHMSFTTVDESAVEVIFNTATEGQTWTVPEGVESLIIKAWGAGGGGGGGGRDEEFGSGKDGGNGGGGGFVQTTLQVDPGDELIIRVGGGGGTGGRSDYYEVIDSFSPIYGYEQHDLRIGTGGGGGGYSGVFEGPTPLIIAAGGGGGGGGDSSNFLYNHGGPGGPGGGTVGINGESGGGGGGGYGGTQVAGGSAPSGEGTPTSGSSLTGGNGGYFVNDLGNVEGGLNGGGQGGAGSFTQELLSPFEYSEYYYAYPGGGGGGAGYFGGSGGSRSADTKAAAGGGGGGSSYTTGSNPYTQPGSGYLAGNREDSYYVGSAGAGGGGGDGGGAADISDPGGNGKDGLIVIIPYSSEAYTIEANVKDGQQTYGTASVVTVPPYESGKVVTIRAQAHTGYSFVRWLLDGEPVTGAGAEYTFTVTANGVFMAEFARNQYSITLSTDPVDSGSVSVIDGSANPWHGENVTVEAVAHDGYNFAGWYENGSNVSTDSSYSFTAERNLNLTANFELSEFTYTITTSVDQAGGGSVTGAGTYTAGESVTITAASGDGYTFLKWVADNGIVITTPSYTFSAGSNRNYVAHFIPGVIFNTATEGQTWTVPAGVEAIFVKAWGAGGGGGGGGYNERNGFGKDGGDGGSGGFAQTTLDVSPGEDLNIIVGGGGAAGRSDLFKVNNNIIISPEEFDIRIGAGGGGGGFSAVYKDSAPLIIAAGGGGGGGGDSSNTLYNEDGGAGGPGGGSVGINGENGGGYGGTQLAGGSAQGEGSPTAGFSLAGGQGGHLGSTIRVDGGLNGGGQGGAGSFAEGSYPEYYAYPGGGGGGAGCYGGGGGAGSGQTYVAGSGGGGGSSYTTGQDQSTQAGSGYIPANYEDTQYDGSAGRGGGGGNGASTALNNHAGGSGRDGLVLIIFEPVIPTGEVTEITVTGAGNEIEVARGAQLQMAAEIIPANASNKTVTWSVEEQTGSATINEHGVLTAASIGTVKVIASAQDGSEVIGEKVISITTPAGEFDFQELVAGTIEITDYNGEDKDVIIPSKINGKAVASIYGEFQAEWSDSDGDGSNDVYTVMPLGGAFLNKGLTSVIIPDSVKNFSSFAFGSNALTNIVIPNGVENIGYSAFEGNQLTSVIIPDSVETIYENAFDGNPLTSITIGECQVLDDGSSGSNAFHQAYDIGGAGTYTKIGGAWVKAVNP